MISGALVQATPLSLAVPASVASFIPETVLAKLVLKENVGMRLCEPSDRGSIAVSQHPIREIFHAVHQQIRRHAPQRLRLEAVSHAA